MRTHMRMSAGTAAGYMHLLCNPRLVWETRHGLLRMKLPLTCMLAMQMLQWAVTLQAAAPPPHRIRPRPPSHASAHSPSRRPCPVDASFPASPRVGA